MSLFKKAQSAVAHNSRIPALGNSDLKQLQDLIHAEKLVVNTNAKAATEIQNSADALRVWSSGEGDDFEDVLPKIALLYEHLSRAQTRYNYYVSTMRLHFKSIRAREEKLADLKTKRRTLANKIESTERKLAKMGPENKDLARVTSSLRELRGDMELSNMQLVQEDAALGDYKRATVVEALALKSGGMMELAEKAIVIAESCRLLAEEIPLTKTAPGEVRAPYRNSARTNRLLQEAVRQIESIHFEPRETTQLDASALASPQMPTSSQMPSQPVADPPTSAKAGAAVAPAAAPHTTSTRADDVDMGSQGWVAPADPAMEAPGHVRSPTGQLGVLPTVHETEDAAYETEEPSRRYSSLQSPAPVAYDPVRGTFPEAPPPPPGTQVPPPANVYDMGHASDVIPSYPPTTAAVEDHDGEPNQAYFEGVGGTKALQQAAARSGNFPMYDQYTAHNNYTPGMFTADPSRGGRSLSPSTLRPIGPGMTTAPAPSQSSLVAPALQEPLSQQHPVPEVVVRDEEAPEAEPHSHSSMPHGDVGALQEPLSQKHPLPTTLEEDEATSAHGTLAHGAVPEYSYGAGREYYQAPPSYLAQTAYPSAPAAETHATYTSAPAASTHTTYTIAAPAMSEPQPPQPPSYTSYAAPATSNGFPSYLSETVPQSAQRGTTSSYMPYMGDVTSYTGASVSQVQ